MIFLACRYHRNGCFGAGFYHVRFRFRADGRMYDATAIVFDAGEHIAIFADDGEVSFRYEHYAKDLRAYVHSPVAQAEAFTN